MQVKNSHHWLFPLLRTLEKLGYTVSSFDKVC